MLSNLLINLKHNILKHHLCVCVAGARGGGVTLGNKQGVLYFNSLYKKKKKKKTQSICIKINLFIDKFLATFKIRCNSLKIVHVNATFLIMALFSADTLSDRLR